MPRTPVNGYPYPAASESPNGPLQVKALADALDGQDPLARGVFLIGEIRQIAVATAPPGWLACNGQAVSTTAYSRLYAVIGTTFGGGSGTFNVPDCRGRALVGAGQAPGQANYPIGSQWGAESVALTGNELPAHAHSGAFHTHDFSGNTGVANANHSHTMPDVWTYGTLTGVNAPGSTGQLSFSRPASRATSEAGAAHIHAFAGTTSGPSAGSTGSAGGNAAHENRPPSIAIPVYIFAGA